MGNLIKLGIYVVVILAIVTLYQHWQSGAPWNLTALQLQLGHTLSQVQHQGQALSTSANQETGRVLGVMTRRMTTEPIWQAITGTIQDEVRAIPYNICQPVVENYESN